MDLLPSAEQQALREAVRGGASGGGADLWKRLGGELGVLGLVVPEEQGGAGAGQAERAVVAEELGRAVALAPAVPFLGSAVLAVDTLLALGVEGDDLLPALAAGERIAAVAVAEGSGGGVLDPATETTATRESSGWRLHGTKTPVVDAEGADVLLVLAGDGEGPAFFRVDADAPGVTVTPLRALDLARGYARVELSGAAGRRLDGDGLAALAGVADRAALVIGAEQVGGMARATDLAVGYAQDRRQFGRPIGSFQAVKHLCADMYVAQELTVGLYRQACWRADHEPERFSEAAELLAAYAGPAYVEVARSMVQVHGGIAYTWEHEAHRHYRRAIADEALLGSAARHRARLATRLEI